VYQLNDENGRRLIADHVQRIKWVTTRKWSLLWW
jgi:hypothetical protein